MSLFNNKLQKVQMGMLAQDVQDRFTNNETQLAQKAQQTDVDISSTSITNNLQMIQTIQSMGVKMSD